MSKPDLKMSAYKQLCKAEESGCHTVEIEEIFTGKRGVANSYGHNVVFTFYGNDDGSDDEVISSKEFNARFKITDMIR